MSDEETIQLIAKVLAWQNGEAIERIATTAATVHYQVDAQQCFEDVRR